MYSIFNNKRVLITGGSGFIGGCLIRRLLSKSDSIIFNLDKLNYASYPLEEKYLKDFNRYKLLKCDLADKPKVEEAINISRPDFVIHLAAESHVDRSIAGPQAFIDSNIVGTFNLIQTLTKYLSKKKEKNIEDFLFHHVSTDEVYGSLGLEGSFNEKSCYDPRSPYSASKAASDHLIMSWFHTYDFPIKLTNCSNNFGPRQYPEKLIPLTISKAIKNQKIPIYGDGSNIRDWLFVEDHIDGILNVMERGKIGEKYCIGGNCEKTNLELVKLICKILDKKITVDYKHQNLIEFVKDRPGHDRRYSIDASKIKSQLNWLPKHAFPEALELTIDWYLNNPKYLKI
tara:strand:+ start:1665 stop:2690 length:1026 start_codon:yes stop_codon:yes gene_type:complete